MEVCGPRWVNVEIANTPHSTLIGLQQTRSLAREEVLKKALIKKISKGMGLVEEMAWQ